ncbi:MAG TPA: hypothetical protein VFS55_00410 [Dokdonella sp.]|nr:hypothetical protein [Dokdonella sp.]
MRKIFPLLVLALAGVAGSASAADATAGAPDRAARRAQLQQRFIDQIDTDHDGSVTRVEYQAWIDARFAGLDANGDGEVDADEIARSPQVAERVRKRAEHFVSRYDASGSGRVSKADFETKAMARFDRLSDGAGVVDADRLLPRRRAGFGRHGDASSAGDDG